MLCEVRCCAVLLCCHALSCTKRVAGHHGPVVAEGAPPHVAALLQRHLHREQQRLRGVRHAGVRVQVAAVVEKGSAQWMVKGW